MSNRMMKYFNSGIVAACVLMSGCRLPTVEQKDPEFVDIYKQYRQQEHNGQKPSHETGKQLTISTQDMPLTEFLRWLSNETGISVVCAESIDTRPVTVDIVKQGVDGILSVVARRLSVQVTRAGSVYYIGQLSVEDRGVLVRKVSRLRGEELIESVQTLLSEHGRVAGYDDGLVIVGDKVEILQRVNELIEGVENAPSDSWFVQLYLISFHDEKLLEYGVDLSLDMLYSKGFFDAADTMGAVLTAAVKASKDEKFVTLVSSPFFVIADGAYAQYVSGQNVPIPRKAVSDQGTVTTTGYEYQQTGLQFRIALRQVQHGKANIAVLFEFSSIVDYIEQAPVTINERFEAVCNVKSAVPYMIGSVKSNKTSDRVSGWLKKDNGGSGDTMQLWCRAYKID